MRDERAGKSGLRGGAGSGKRERIGGGRAGLLVVLRRLGGGVGRLLALPLRLCGAVIRDSLHVPYPRSGRGQRRPGEAGGHRPRRLPLLGAVLTMAM